MTEFGKIRSWTDVFVSSACPPITKSLKIQVIILFSSFIPAHIRVYKAVRVAHLHLHPHTKLIFCLTKAHLLAAYACSSRCYLSDGDLYRRGRKNAYKEGQKHDMTLISVYLPTSEHRHDATVIRLWKDPARADTNTTHMAGRLASQMPSFHPCLLPRTAQRTTTHVINHYNHTLSPQSSSSILKLYSFQST